MRSRMSKKLVIDIGRVIEEELTLLSELAEFKRDLPGDKAEKLRGFCAASLRNHTMQENGQGICRLDL
jgi:hypothetical protein